MAKVDVERVIAYEKDGRLRVQKHPDRPLFIANYTQTVQWERQWDDLTLMCRGLIFADDGTIVARPFQKFFNYGEGAMPPDEPFTVTEKVDGSLGILYQVPGMFPAIASRGSFTSDQAVRANDILRSRYGIYGTRDPLKQGPSFNPAHTYLFEIIYPENRIVVNYGDKEELVLLAIIDTETGADLPITDEPWLLDYFRTVEPYGDGCCTGCIEDLLYENEGRDNFEGFVLRYESGLRLKVKLQEYLRLHKLVTGVNSRRIWELLAAHQDISPYLDCVPDEFAAWVRAECAKLMLDHTALATGAQEIFEGLRRDAARAVGFHDASIAGSLGMGREMRKEFALRAGKYPTISGLLFTLYDGGSIDALVWKMVRPEEATTPYAADSEG